MSVHRAATVPTRVRLSAAWERVATGAATFAGKSLRGIPGYAAVGASIIFAEQIWHPLMWGTAAVWLLIIDRKMP